MKTSKILLAAGLLLPGAVFGQVSPYRGLWVGEVRLDAVNEVSVPLDEHNIARAPNPAVTTKTFDAANLRLILHVNGAGQVSLLKQVAILNRKASEAKSANDLALVTDERLYGSFPPQPAQRIASVVFDFGDRKATDAVDAVVNAAAEAASAVIMTGQDQAAAQAVAQAEAAKVIAASDAAERYAVFLRDVMNTAAVTALSVSGQATAAQDTAAAALKTNSFYTDTRGGSMIAALEAAVTTGTAAEKKKAAQNVAAFYADVANNYQRFLAGELMGNALSAAADAAATAAAAAVRRDITAITETASTAPVSITTANHGLINGVKISISGAPIAAYNGLHTVTKVNANVFTVPVAFVAGKPVTGYAASANLSPVTVSSPGHGLQTGARIVISGATTAGYNGTYYITRISDDEFSIPAAYAGNTGESGVWASRAGGISGYESAPGGGSAVKVTSPNHGLNNGEHIVISGAGLTAYNGKRAITRIDANSFTIPVPFGGNPAAKGAWSVQNIIAGYSEPAMRTTTVTSAAHGLNNGDRITISGAGKAAYNATFTVERVSADAFSIPVTFVAADGNPAVKGAWAPAVGGSWRGYDAIFDAADSNAKIGDARAEALRIKALTAFDDTRGTDAINAVIVAITAAAADAPGTTKGEILLLAEAAGRLALTEMVAHSAIPGITPTPDYTAFVRAVDARFTDFREIAPLVAAAAAAGAAGEFANVLHTTDSVKIKAKERAVAAITSVYEAAARALRTELPMSGDFGPGATGLTGTIMLPANHPTNPFRHRRHPDHATGFDITRVLTLNFDGAGGDTLASAGFGVESISGTYGEEVFGLHKPLGPNKDTGLKVSGTFTLNRISLIDALNAR